jgi:hypothetical protein
MLPKMGKKLHRPSDSDSGNGQFAAIIATALKNELGTTHQGIKTAMRWTGASERTAKHWFSGTHGPNGAHLVELARHSDEILRVFLVMADRRPQAIATKLTDLHRRLLEVAEYLEEQL